jgi:predicted GNAT family acetyltransferase
MTELERALGLIRAMQERTAEQVVPTPNGPFFLNERLGHFAAFEEGRPVSYATLYHDGAVGQIEDVLTLPGFRGRGLAGAVVLRAVAESEAAGSDLTFLVTDAGDWPQRLYGKLGFAEIDRYGRYVLRR